MCVRRDNAESNSIDNLNSVIIIIIIIIIIINSPRRRQDTAAGTDVAMTSRDDV